MKARKLSKQVICLLSYVVFLLPVTAKASMILSFESSATSWVGQGQSRLITPKQGYEFVANSSSNNSVLFSITYKSSPEYPPTDWWQLDLGTPFGAPFKVGLYENATRWPFQDASDPGLTFSGNHRGNNTNLGFFKVLEVNYDTSGKLEKFAVDFTQYGEQSSKNWINGKLRFNSDIPITVPEPTPFFLLVIGLIGLTRYANKGAAS